MGPSDNCIYCAWHVLKAWRTNVNNKINTKETRDNVSKMLQTLLYELDQDAFKKMLHEALRRMSNDEQTHSFYEYFEKQYVNNEQYSLYARTRTIINVI